MLVLSIRACRSLYLLKEDRQEFNVRVAKNIESGLFDPLAAVGEQLEQLKALHESEGIPMVDVSLVLEKMSSEDFMKNRSKKLRGKVEKGNIRNK